MNKFLFPTLFMLYALPSSTLAACPKTLDFDVRPLTGDKTINLCEAYQGKVVLIVNTASKCGFTPQYEGLEALYRQYREQGLVVLGFPSNDFGGQEPGSEQEIQSFCRLTYGVEFPMFEKMSVSEKNPHPFYQLLASLAEEYPRWNFHKYLLDRQGKLVGSYSSRVKPDDPQLITTIDALLKQ